VVIYPRDQIAAFKSLLEAASHSVLPEKQSSSPSSHAKDTESRGTLKPFFGARTDFTSVETVTPDGRKFTVTVGQDNNVIIEQAEGVD